VSNKQTKRNQHKTSVSVEEILIAVLAIGPFSIFIRLLIFLFSVVKGINITKTKESVRNTFTRRWQLLPKHVVNFLDNVTPARVLAVFKINNNSAVSYTNQGTSIYKCQFYNSANKSNLSHKGFRWKILMKARSFIV
jgi:hypothetical protein